MNPKNPVSPISHMSSMVAISPMGPMRLDYGMKCPKMTRTKGADGKALCLSSYPTLSGLERIKSGSYIYLISLRALLHIKRVPYIELYIRVPPP